MTATNLLKRLTAVGGLLLITPIALQLITGDLTPADAGIRALALFGGVIFIRRLANLAPTPNLVVTDHVTPEPDPN